MKLHDYLSKHKIAPAEFARLVGKSEWGVRKWMYGDRTPRYEVMQRIVKATGGLVGPADFFEGADR